MTDLIAIRVHDVNTRKEVAADGRTHVMRVSAMTPVNTLGGAIAKALRDRREVILQAIGTPACYQALKGVATAGRFVQGDGYQLLVVIHWKSFEIEGREITGIEFHATGREEARGEDAFSRDEIRGPR